MAPPGPQEMGPPEMGPLKKGPLETGPLEKGAVGPEERPAGELPPALQPRLGAAPTEPAAGLAHPTGWPERRQPRAAAAQTLKRCQRQFINYEQRWLLANAKELAQSRFVDKRQSDGGALTAAVRRRSERLPKPGGEERLSISNPPDFAAPVHGLVLWRMVYCRSSRVISRVGANVVGICEAENPKRSHVFTIRSLENPLCRDSY